MTESPTGVFSKRMAAYRQRRGWSQADLAAQLTKHGVKMHRVQVAKIEGRARGVSLDEAIAIAWVLGLPPALLYLPLGETSEFAPIPDQSIHPDLARQWVIGEEPATHSNQRTRQTQHWFEDMSIWWLHDRLNAAQHEVDRLRSAGAEDTDEYAQAIQGLSKVLLEFHKAGLSTPKHPKAVADAMAQALRDEEE